MSPIASEKKRKRAQESTRKSKKTKSESGPAATSPKRTKTVAVTKDAPVAVIPSSLKKPTDEETAFPRGGAHALTPLEYKEVANEAAKDVLFEAGGAAAGGDIEIKMGKKSKRFEGQKGKKSTERTVKKETGPKVEGLSFKRLIPGTLVLGCVQTINRTDIALSLPNNLTGFIPISQMSDKLTSRILALADEPESDNEEQEDNTDSKSDSEDIELSSLFRVGQYLRACVVESVEVDNVKTEKKNTPAKLKKRIELSILPSMVNTGLSGTEAPIGCTLQASVASVEDHGLVMDLGLESDVKGFLSSKELGTNFAISMAQEGQVLLCTVTGRSSNGKIVKLSADLEQKFSKKGKLAGGKASWWLSEAPSIEMFLPGTGVEVLITDVGKQGGVVGKIMGMLDAVADFFHVAAWEKDLEEKIKVGSKIKTRITCIYPDSDPKKVSFSILPHILSFVPPSETDPLTALPISTIIESAKIVGVESRVGLFVDVGVPNVPGFVHISRISSDSKIEDLIKDAGPYKIGTTHAARILGFNPMDGLYIISMEKRVLEQPFLRVEEISVGAVVKGKVEKVLDRGGLTLTLADGIIGLAEEEHVSDVKLRNPEKKFRVGMEFKARVLATNPTKRKIWLSLKKTLVNSDLPIITSYDVSPGTQTVGTLVSILSNGAVVKFFSGVTAFLPVSEMSEAFISDPRDHFRVGQSINVNVLFVDPENQKMRVSCKDPSAFGEAQHKALEEIKPGQIISGNISEKSDDDLVLDLDGVGVKGLKGVLMIGHLTDGSREKNFNTMRKLRAGQTLSDLVVVDKNAGRRMVSLSMKPSLVKASKAGMIVDSFSKINEGILIKGFVKNVAGMGVFVSFAGGVTGLALKNALPLVSQSLPNFGYQKLQSVSARVIAVDHSQEKFLLSLKPEDEEPARMAKPMQVDPKSAINPVDGDSKTVDDYTPGTLTKAKIVSVQETQINVQLADNIQGRVDVSQLFDSWDDIKNKKAPLGSFKKGDILDVRVIGIHDARNHRFLPITHRTSNKKAPIFELTAKPRDLKSDNYDVLTLDKVIIGSNWMTFVNNIVSDCVWVNISSGTRGRIRLLDISDDVTQLRDIKKHFPVGSALKCHVVNVDHDHGKLDLSARNFSVSKLDYDALSKGMVVPGRVTKVMDRQIIVGLGDSIAGVINMTEIADDFSLAKISDFSKNDIIRVCVIEVDKSNKRVILSTRPSRTLDPALPVKDSEVYSVHDIKERELRRGFVKNVSDKGLFITLGRNVTAWVKVSDLSDGFLKDWKSKFQIDQVVEGRVIAVESQLGHIQMSLRPSAISGNLLSQAGLSDFKKGQIIQGKVKKVAEYGVFVSINGSNVSGLCHKSQIADRKIDDFSKLYVEGDPVKAKILDIDVEKRRISFGLKASYFVDEDEGEGKEDSSDSEDGGMQLDDEDDGEDEDEGEGDEGEDEDEDDASEDDSVGGVVDLKGMDEDSEDEDNHNDNEDVEMDDSPAISSGVGFDWNAENIFGDKRERGEDSDEDGIERFKRKRKRRNDIQQDLTGEMITREPQSAADYERLILGDPNDSRLWIQYMAFQLQLGEIEAGRKIAERALETIGQREDAEKRNIWVALLNMENSYGDNDTVEETFKRAVQFVDAMDIHERLASIYIQSGKTEKADTLFRSMIKKFSQSPKIWVNYGDFLLTNNNRSTAREMLKRAMQALSKDLHRDLIIKYASMEFRTGDPERGRTLFEKMVGAYNKRMDIWNVFLDMEMKHGGAEKDQIDHTRRLFKRALGEEKCSPKQASLLFKKWKVYEEKIGDEKGVKDVQARAKIYVEKQKAASTTAQE